MTLVLLLELAESKYQQLSGPMRLGSEKIELEAAVDFTMVALSAVLPPCRDILVFAYTSVGFRFGLCSPSTNEKGPHLPVSSLSALSLSTSCAFKTPLSSWTVLSS